MFHLDPLFHLPNILWQKRSEDNFLRLHNKVIQGDSWVTDGNSHQCPKTRLEQATGLNFISSDLSWHCHNTGLKVAGGCYLLWLALKMFRRPSNRFNDSADTEEISVSKAFMTGVFTQISNPHTALVFASIFSAALSKNIQPVMYIILPTMAFVIDLLWYAVVACLLSTDGPRQAYIKYRKFIDKLSGGVMAFLGIRLLLK